MSLSDPPPTGADAGSGANPTAQVELVSRNASLELSVVASDFRPLAGGMGRLSATLAPGIYQVVARAGPVVERKLVRLEAGAVYRDDNVAVAFPSPAPVRDTTTAHEYHQVAAEQASNAVVQATGPPSGLVVVVRDVRGQQGPPFAVDDVAPFGLLDESLRPVEGFEGGWTVQAAEAVATWSRRLPAGGYVLRTDPSRGGGGDRHSASTQAFDQSIWLSDSWQTIVFITTGPGGPRTSAASVHMNSVDLAWSPHEVDVLNALELAMLGLREGRSVLPNDLLGVLLGTKFVNPMLGLIGAHSLLLRDAPDPDLLNVVVNNLEGMLPGHPDVLALRWIAATRGAAGASRDASAAGAPGGGATWPPMLLPSYRGLIDMDAAHPNAISDGSVAERAAANLLVQGVWTSWLPLPLAPPPGPRGADVAGVLPLLARDPSLIENVPLADPATARVAGYLGALAALEGPAGRVERFASLSAQEIGLATTLPVSTVNRALARIATALAPPLVPPRGIGRLISGSLPIVAAGALLLAGVVGAVAWCAGSDACPLGGGADPTPSPTATQTPPPTVATTQPARTRPPTASPPPATPIALDYLEKLDFEEVTIGGDPGLRELAVRFREPVPIRIELAENLDEAFTLEDGCLGMDPNSSLLECTALVAFRPARAGEHIGALALFAGEEAQPRTIHLIGQGVAPFLRYEDRLEFGDATVNRPIRKELVVFATERVPFQVGIIEGETGVFVPEACEWVEVGSEQFECTVWVVFNPSRTGDHFAILGIFTAEPDPRKIELTGSGSDPIF